MTVEELLKTLSKLTDEQKRLPVGFEYVYSMDGSDYERDEPVEHVFVRSDCVMLS